MKKNVKTSEVLDVYKIISTAKYGKLSDEEKVKVWKVTRKIKPVATKFDEDAKDAADKMKPCEDFDEKMDKAVEYRNAVKSGRSTDGMISAAEFAELDRQFYEYNKLVNKAVKEFAEKIVKIDFEPVSEETFGKLMASNDWTMEQAAVLGDFITE